MFIDGEVTARPLLLIVSHKNAIPYMSTDLRYNNLIWKTLILTSIQIKLFHTVEINLHTQRFNLLRMLIEIAAWN